MELESALALALALALLLAMLASLTLRCAVDLKECQTAAARGKEVYCALQVRIGRACVVAASHERAGAATYIRSLHPPRLQTLGRRWHPGPALPSAALPRHCSITAGEGFELPLGSIGVAPVPRCSLTTCRLPRSRLLPRRCLAEIGPVARPAHPCPAAWGDPTIGASDAPKSFPGVVLPYLLSAALHSRPPCRSTAQTRTRGLDTNAARPQVE